MHFSHVLFLLFLAVPLLEIVLLIQVGGLIGVLPTVGLVVLTAVIGVALLRRQGLATLVRAQRSLDQGVMPAMELLEGAGLLLAGAFLLTPGFATDAAGFLLLTPAVRRWLVERVIRQGFVRVPETGAQGHPPQHGNTIEGEFRREDP